MEQIKKADVIKLIADLRAKGFTQEELGVALGRSGQTIWCWSSDTMPKRVPCKRDYEVLIHLLEK